MPLQPQEAMLESTAEKIARIITRQYGVQVRIQGRMAYYDFEHEIINLPNLKDEDLGEISGVFDGFLDHECAHPLFTSVEACRAVKGDRTLHYIWNAIEDFYVERCLSAQYLGCGQNLERLHQALRKKIESEWDERDMLSRMLFAMLLIWRGESVLSDWVNDPKMGSLIQELEPEIQEAPGVTNSMECVAWAKKVLEKIESLVPEEEKLQESKPQQSEDEGEGEQQESLAGGGEESGTEESGAGEAEADESLEAEADELEAGELGDAPGQAQEQAQEFSEKRAKGTFQKPLDAEGLVNEQMTEFEDWSTKKDPDKYVVFTEEFDQEITFSREDRLQKSTRYSQLKNEVAQYIGTMATQLELSLAAEAESRWVGGSRRGRKFDKHRLSQWFMGSDDDRIFTQLEEGEQHDTAVSLLWDCSGSMGHAEHRGQKAALARIAAIAFHESLVRANIMHEVLGFNTGGKAPRELYEAIKAARSRGENLEMYSRLDDLDNRFVFVPWGQTDGRAICNLTGGAANRDGECVLWAAKRLAARPESRKILIVGSDGHPQGARFHYTEKKYLQEVVQQIIESGIELYAIGIMDDSVKHYYPHWVTIQDPKDLPRVVLRQLGQSLLNRKGRRNANLPEFSRPTM